MPSIVDVARLAQVGIATVSRTINGEKGVKAATRSRVFAAMQELSYVVPESGHRRGPRRRGDLQIYQVRILHQGGLARYYDANPLFADILGTMDACFIKAGHHLEIRNGVTHSSAVVSGTVFIGPHGSAQTIPSSLIPGAVLWLMGHPGTFPCDHVGPNHAKAGLIAAEYALQRGHRRGAYLGRSQGSPAHPTGHRGDAFAWRMAQGGGSTSLLLDERLAAPIPAGKDTELMVMAGLLAPILRSESQRPTVILVDGDGLTVLLYAALRNAGVEPMRDLEVISCNHEEPHLQQMHPRPISVDLNPQEIGKQAAERLMARAAEPTGPFLTITVEPHLHFPD